MLRELLILNVIYYVHVCIVKRVIAFCAVEVGSRFYLTRDGGWKGGVISSQTSIKIKKKEVELGITFEVFPM